MWISIKLLEFKITQQKRQLVESLQCRQFPLDQAKFWYRNTQRSYLNNAKVLTLIGFQNLILCKFLSQTKFSLVIVKNSFINDKLQRKRFCAQLKNFFVDRFHFTMLIFLLNAQCKSLCGNLALVTLKELLT